MARKLTREIFISKSKNIHGSIFNYEKVDYINYNTKVQLMCSKGHIFWQAPLNHLQGNGCSICSKKLQTADMFIQKANKVHNNKYDYSLVEYKNNHTKVQIICPEHGNFLQNPSNHTLGQNCPKCGLKKRSFSRRQTADMFIQKANKVHNNKYDYSLVEYKNNHTKVQIICPEHGNFLQNPNNHLNGNRCPMCFIPGFNVDKPAILYFIKDVNTELYKIGITNRSIHQRFKPLKENKDYLILDYWYYKKGIDAYKAERKILTYFKSDRVVNDEWDSRISGATEFFSSNIIQHKNFQKIQEIKKGYKIMARKIIAFIGRRGSGKDTTADLFAEWFKEENADALIASFAFAGTIKDIVHDTLSISTEQSEFLKRNPEIKIANGMDLREFYNHFGDVLKSRFGKRIFTEKTVEDITRTLSSVEPDLILVTDVRYPMEQAALKKLGEDQGLDVHFIKMVNTNLAGLPKEPGEHESESLSDDIFGDSTIVASSTQELSNKAQGIYNELYPTN